MNNIKKLLCLILITSLVAHAQNNEKGIQWTTGLSFEQVKAKAKAENKYIFLDVFATWCGPCKLMDKQVYVNDTVGKFFNEKFISVKVQMDKTAKDDDQIRSWYNDAEIIKKQYHISAFPTFVYLNPEGVLVEQRSGFRDVNSFVSLAEGAAKPGKVYLYHEYNELIEAYNNGERNYAKYPYMIKAAEQLWDTVANQLRRDLRDYMSTLPRKERYTADRMKAFDGRVYVSTSKVYGFYWKDGKLIDKVVGEKGYSKRRIDETIRAEIIEPFLKEQNKNPEIARTRGMMGVGGAKLPEDYSEADWDKLEKLIREKYNTVYTKRNLLKAKIEWYSRNRNQPQLIKYSLIRLKKYPPDTNVMSENLMANMYCWNAFLYSTDKIILREYAKCLERVIKESKVAYAANMDTYANLLYKLGKKEEAIYWEEKAVELRPGKEFSEVIEIMQKGQPTYLQAGAVWTGVKTVSWNGVKFNKLILVKDKNGNPMSGAIIKNKQTEEVQKSGVKGYARISVSVGDLLIVSAQDCETVRITIGEDSSQSTIALKTNR